MKIKIWGIYTQSYPTYKLEVDLHSLWTSKDVALEVAKNLKDDYISVAEVVVNSEQMLDVTCKNIVVKQRN